VRFEHSAVVDGGVEEVFQLTQDYGRRLQWDPFLRKAELVGGAVEPGVGVHAWCVSRLGLGMETAYVSYKPPHLAAVTMTRGPRLLRRFGGTWEYEPVAGAKTRVTFRYFLDVRPSWLEPMLEPLARGWFAWETRRRVAGLARFLEGRPGRL